jgi:hypothetical protein
MRIPPVHQQAQQVLQHVLAKATEQTAPKARTLAQTTESAAKTMDSRLDESHVFRVADQAAAKAVLGGIKAAALSKDAAKVMLALGAMPLGAALMLQQVPDILMSKALGSALDAGVDKGLDALLANPKVDKALDKGIDKLVESLMKSKGNPPLDERKVQQLSQEAKAHHIGSQRSLPALGVLDIGQKMQRSLQGDSAFR